MINVVICMMTNAFRIYLIYRFLNCFFENDNENKIKKFIYYFSFFMINTVLYLRYHLVVINMWSNLLGILFLVKLYNSRIKTILFVTSAIYLANMGSDIITVMLFVDYQSGKEFNQIYEMITVLLLVISELVIEKILNNKRGTIIDIQNVPLVFIPMCSIGVLVYLTHSNSAMSNVCIVVAISLFSINFFILYLYNLVCRSFNEGVENSILKQKIEEYSNQLNMYMETEKRVKALKHDMKHHLSELKIMAVNCNMLGIQEYIDEMEEFLKNPNEMVATGNVEIDSLLNFLLQKAQKELTDVKANVVLKEPIKNCFDVNIILGNLLENAIEASAKSRLKKLDVSIEAKQGVLRIRIKNSYGNLILKRNNVFLTTKNEKESHGIGLNNVKRIVEKYNGLFESSYDEENFSINAILYMANE